MSEGLDFSKPAECSPGSPDAGPSLPGEYIIEARGLTKLFTSGQDQLRILDNLDLAITPGKSLAILGSSGSGKSTLMHILGGLARPTSGQLHFRGVEIFSKSEDGLAAWRNSTVGFVFQFHHLLGDFTALENAAMPAMLAGQSRRVAKERAMPILERVGLGARVGHRPGELSGGEQQRVALARALVMEPQVLLADEPTGNLDAKSAEAVNELILELVAEKNLTAIIVTHNNRLAAVVDQTMELSGGKLHLPA